MKAVQAQVLSFFVIACLCLAGFAAAQDAQIEPGSERPMFTHLPPTLHSARVSQPPVTPLTTWNGSFTSGGTTYNYNMVGVAPTLGSSATIPTVIIPVKIVISNGATFDPSAVLSNGNTVVQNTVASPIFASIPFTSGGISMGTTQYIDAFQRANFWGAAAGNPSHLLLGAPAVKALQTLKVPNRSGTTGVVFGFTAGLVDINYFDTQVHNMLTSLGITPNTFPIFLTYNVYLTQHHSCCIGGYHSSVGTLGSAQSYAHATYVSTVGAFAQDVSALSHEVGEWADDPLVNNSGNNTPCGILENGDPLENNANFGGFPYTVNGFTYNLQDLTTLPYFGAPPSTSVNNEFTFQGEALTVCQNGS